MPPEITPVPWSDGERLIYSISWKGLVIGQQVIEAHKAGFGWHYTGEVKNSGLASIIGFSMKVDSYVRADLFTRHFRRELTVPGEGRRVLTAVVGKETKVSFVWVDGSVHRFSSPQTSVLDDASVLYYVRVHPDPQKLWFINYPSLVNAPLHSLGQKTILTRLGRFSAEGYLFSGDGTRIEVWYATSKERWPLRIFFGQKWGGFTASLIGVEHVR
ncbi:DUF3108 domain-containing protein [Oceanithermus sp.]